MPPKFRSTGKSFNKLASAAAVSLPTGGPHPLQYFADRNYYLCNGVRCRTLSKILDGFFPFDSEAVAAKLAASKGRQVDDIKSEWRAQADMSFTLKDFTSTLLNDLKRFQKDNSTTNRSKGGITGISAALSWDDFLARSNIQSATTLGSDPLVLQQEENDAGESSTSKTTEGNSSLSSSFGSLEEQQTSSEVSEYFYMAEGKNGKKTSKPLFELLYASSSSSSSSFAAGGGGGPQGKKKQPQPAPGGTANRKIRPLPNLPDATIQGYLNRALKTFEQLHNEYEIIEIEPRFYSPAYNVVAAVDALAKHRESGHLMLCDWKATGQGKSSFKFGPFDEPCGAGGTGDGCGGPWLVQAINGKFQRAGLQVALAAHIMRIGNYQKLYGADAADAGRTKLGVTTLHPTGNGESLFVNSSRVVDEESLFLPTDNHGTIPLEWVYDRILTVGPKADDAQPQQQQRGKTKSL